MICQNSIKKKKKYETIELKRAQFSFSAKKELTKNVGVLYLSLATLKIGVPKKNMKPRAQQGSMGLKFRSLAFFPMAYTTRLKRALNCFKNID